MTPFERGVARAVEAREVARESMIAKVEELEPAETAGTLSVDDQVALNGARWRLDQIAAAEARERTTHATA